jgi:ParB family chromosome partitioning protein
MPKAKNLFNVSQLLSNASLQAGNEATEETPRRPMLKVIPIKITDLIPSSDNFYSVDKIAELKTSIEMFGVLQNLIVKPLDGGKYEIIAGHRRHAACVELAAEGKIEFEYVPCGIQSECDEIKERILLIMTNSTTRELSDFEKMKQAEELTKYFTALKKRDSLTGRVRDLVAEALNVSSAQVARMTAITNNLAPELKAELEAGRIGLSAAYELSGATVDAQREALTVLQEKGGLSINDAKVKKHEPPTTDAAPKPPPPEYTPKDHPETPEGFEEGQEDAPEITDFADMSEAEKAEAAITFFNRKRFTLFAPGEDARVFDYVIEILENHAEV